MAQGWKTDFEAFAREIQGAMIYSQSDEMRSAFIRQHKKELALAVQYLHVLGVIGQLEWHSSPPDQCDFCNRDISRFGFFIDGSTGGGPWANMCPACFSENGNGIGWGIGQLYKADGEGRWICVGGGAPLSPPEEMET